MRVMAIVGLFLLSSCGEPDFDRQYAETEKQLEEDAARLEAEMAKEAKKEPGEAARRQ